MIGSHGARTLSIVIFCVLVAGSLGVTYYASRRASGASGFFVAGRRITARQNALAIVGDLFSAAAFLGISGIVALSGFDGVMYSIGFVVALIAVLLVVAEPLRNTGRYTMTDVIAYRFRDPKVRGTAAAVSIVIILFYLLAQMVGVGVITSLLLGLDAKASIAVVGVLMMVYVTFGGMVATTYVQLLKSFLLISATVLLTVLLLARFGFDFSHILHQAEANSGKGGAFLVPGLKYTNHADLFSLGLGLVLGTAGLAIGASAHVAHDIYTHVLRGGAVDERREVRVAKVASPAVGVVAIVLALAARSMNIAFLVGLAFAIAASTNLPVLLYTLYWRRFNAGGAIAGLVVGAVTSVGLALVGPSVIGPDGIALHGTHPLTALANPGIISVPAGFLAGFLGTLLTTREAAAAQRFEALRIRALTGYGAEMSEAPS